MGKNGNVVQLRGKRFGFLTVLRRAGSIKTSPAKGSVRAAWLCRCDCGTEVVVRADRLRGGTQKACGKGHNFSKNRTRNQPNEFRCYNAMMQRCYNTEDIGYKNYGAKGVTVCDRWRGHFDNFFADLGPRPSLKHSLDRYPKFDGNYEPGNVRWATDKEQARNRADSVKVIFNGQVVTLADYAEQTGMTASMLRRRLARGWGVEKALTTPARPQASKPEDKAQ